MFDFPNSPTVGQTVTGPGGVRYTWDGTKWANSLNASAFAPLNSPPFTGTPTAPTPPATDSSSRLATTSFTQAALAPYANNVGRNLIHNGMFNVQQRGAGVFNAGAGGAIYTADRWLAATAIASDTLTVQLVAQNDANRAQIGDEAPQYLLSAAFASTGAGGVCDVMQRIENVRRLANKTLIVSFWANASAALILGANMAQNFGSGGSPSASVGTAFQTVTLSTTWARYSMTFALPSIAGKTLGTNGNDQTTLTLFFANQAVAGIDSQSGTINLWGVQLEIAQPGQTALSPLEKIEYGEDLRRCQRFYQVGNTEMLCAGYTASAYVSAQVTLPVKMRAAPSVTSNFPSPTNTTTATVGALGPDALIASAQATAAGNVIAAGTYTASADL